MPTVKTVLHVPTGEFRNKTGQEEFGYFEPQRPILSVTNGQTTYDPDYDVVVVPRMPDPRIEKWNGSAIVAKTQAELDAYDAKQPKLVSTREFIRRFTQPERARIRALARTNEDVADLLDELLAGGDTNLNDVRFVAGLNSLKAGLIPSVWADVAAADARIAVLRA